MTEHMKRRVGQCANGDCVPRVRRSIVQVIGVAVCSRNRLPTEREKTAQRQHVVESMKDALHAKMCQQVASKGVSKPSEHFCPTIAFPATNADGGFAQLHERGSEGIGHRFAPPPLVATSI